MSAIILWNSILIIIGFSGDFLGKVFPAGKENKIRKCDWKNGEKIAKGSARRGFEILNFQFFATFCDGHQTVPRVGACVTHCPKNSSDLCKHKV